MNITPECKVCILNQSQRVLTTIGANATLSKRVLDETFKILSEQEYNISPPEVANLTYGIISEMSGIEDLYKNEKLEATKKAKTFIPFIEQKIDNSNDEFLYSLKTAVAGNVLDLATPTDFNLNDEIEKIFDKDFAINDSKKLFDDLKEAKEILILADNAGEHIFDKIFINNLKKLFPKLTINYATRGIPIINDVTFDEAKNDGLDKICNLIDSGVNTPAFIYDRANENAQKIYDRVDLVISKGMGNFETLNEIDNKKIYFLFKVKCNVVANQVGQKLGEIICKLNLK